MYTFNRSFGVLTILSKHYCNISYWIINADRAKWMFSMQLTKMAIYRDRNTIQSQLLGPFQRNSEKPLECINITGCLNFIQNRVFSISLNIGQTIFYVSSVVFLTTVYIIKFIKDQLTSQQILRCVLNQIFTKEGFVMYA